MPLPYGITVGWRAWTGDPDVVDALANVIDSWADPVDIHGCALDPGSSSEPRDGSAQRVITDPVLYVPTGHVIAERDRFVISAKTYEVEGKPKDWGSHPMTGWTPGMLVIPVRRVEG